MLFGCSPIFIFCGALIFITNCFALSDIIAQSFSSLYRPDIGTCWIGWRFLCSYIISWFIYSCHDCVGKNCVEYKCKTLHDYNSLFTNIDKMFFLVWHTTRVSNVSLSTVFWWLRRNWMWEKYKQWPAHHYTWAGRSARQKDIMNSISKWLSF